MLAVRTAMDEDASCRAAGAGFCYNYLTTRAQGSQYDYNRSLTGARVYSEDLIRVRKQQHTLQGSGGMAAHWESTEQPPELVTLGGACFPPACRSECARVVPWDALHGNTTLQTCTTK